MPPTELRRKHGFLPPAAEGLAEEGLALAAAVALGRVEEVHAGIESGVDHGTRPRLVHAPSEVVAAEADDGNLERAERPRPHVRRA